MKRSALILISTVFFSSTALASEPMASPSTGQSMVAGIDARSGKLRQLSDAEVAELSRQAQSQGATRQRIANAAWAAIPQTGAEAERTLRVLPNGMSVATLPLSAMNAMTARIDEQGVLQISESDHEHAHAVQEVSE